MHENAGIHMHSHMNECIHECMHAFMHACVYECACMFESMHAYMNAIPRVEFSQGQSCIVDRACLYFIVLNWSLLLFCWYPLCKLVYKCMIILLHNYKSV